MDSAAAILASWTGWLRRNRDRGCNRNDLIDRALAQGYRLAAIEAVLDEVVHQPPVNWLSWFEAPLTRADHQPRAWRLDTPLAQVYELPGLLGRDECEEVIAAINESLQPSTVTRGSSDYRTSRTCHLSQNRPELAKRLDQRFAALLGVDPRLSEPIQGQRYDPGEYFMEHTDWFAPGTKEFEKNTAKGGQRTWTVMIYLNAVERGG